MNFNPHALPPPLLQILPALIAAITCFSISAFVYSKDKTSDLNKFFALYNSCLGLWNLGDFFVIISDTPSSALLWDRFAYVGGVFLGPLWIYFSLAFTEIKSEKATYRILWAFFLFACVLAPITFFTPWVIRAVTISPFKELEGHLYPLFVIFGSFSFQVGNSGKIRIKKGGNDERSSILI